MMTKDATFCGLYRVALIVIQIVDVVVDVDLVFDGDGGVDVGVSRAAQVDAQTASP